MSSELLIPSIGILRFAVASLVALNFTLLAGCEGNSKTSDPTAKAVEKAQEDLANATSDAEKAVNGEAGKNVTERERPETTLSPVGARLTPAHSGKRAESVVEDTANDSQRGTKDVSFDDLKFDIEKDGEFKREMLTDKINQLAGNRIRIRGYILPSFKAKGIKQFVLVRDNKECCFGPGAAIYDCIIVRMEKGKSTSFTVRPVTVEGAFQIEEFKPAERLQSIYSLRASSVD